MSPNLKSPSTTKKGKGILIKQSPRLALIVLGLGFLLLFLPIQPWPSVVICIFGLFLLIQSFILELEFTPEDLVVWQLGRELRRFPFKNWLAWRLFLPSLPGIFYFREEASPHLLPILFDSEMLREQLRQKVGALEIPKQSLKSSAKS